MGARRLVKLAQVFDPESAAARDLSAQIEAFVQAAAAPPLAAVDAGRASPQTDSEADRDRDPDRDRDAATATATPTPTPTPPPPPAPSASVKWL